MHSAEIRVLADLNEKHFIQNTYVVAVTNTISFQCCFTSTETVRPIRNGEPRMATSTFTQLLRSEANTNSFQFSFQSAATTRLIRDEEPRTATSTLTQLLPQQMVRVSFIRISP